MEKWVTFVAKLLELTQKGQIRWEMAGTVSFLPANERATHAYVAEFLDRRMRLYRYQYSAERPIHGLRDILTSGPTFDWVDAVKLEFVDPAGRALYEIPPVIGLWDLYNSVQYNTAGIDEFVDKVASYPAA